MQTLYRENGLEEKKTAPGLARLNSKATSGGYGGIGKKGKDIMLRGEKELASDFSKRIIDARNKRGWDKRELVEEWLKKSISSIMLNLEKDRLMQ